MVLDNIGQILISCAFVEPVVWLSRQVSLQDRSASKTGQPPRQVSLPDRSASQTGQTPRQVSLPDRSVSQTGQPPRQPSEKDKAQDKTHDKPPTDSITAKSLHDLIHNALCMDMHMSTLVYISIHIYIYIYDCEVSDLNCASHSCMMHHALSRTNLPERIRGLITSMTIPS